MDDAAVVSGSDLNADDSSSSEEENENFMDEFDDDNNSNNNNNQQTNKRISDCKNDNGSETDSDDENEGHHDYGIPRRDILYNPNKDEEDEAYVYRNLRGGMNELVSMKVSNNQKRRNVSSVSRPSSSTSVSDSYNNNDNTKNNINKNNSNNNNNNNGGEEGGKLTRVLKPRNSDAVLSCPCCFQIVCMDCQRHDRYTNQFRAMFVMNIGVDWERIVTPMGKQNTGHYLNGGQNYNNNNDNTHESSSHPLLHKKKRVEKIPTDDLQDDNNIHTFRGDDTEGEVYYSVHCVSCRTEVAALNMEDEVYHFFGCLASS